MGRAYGGLLVTPNDRRAGKIVRLRDRYTCQRCGRVYQSGSQALHSCHIFDRGRLRTRYELDNLFAGCYGCHMILDRRHDEMREFAISRLGEARYEELRVLSKVPVTMARVLYEEQERLRLNALLKQYESGSAPSAAMRNPNSPSDSTGARVGTDTSQS